MRGRPRPILSLGVFLLCIAGCTGGPHVDGCALTIHLCSECSSALRDPSLAKTAACVDIYQKYVGSVPGYVSDGDYCQKRANPVDNADCADCLGHAACESIAAGACDSLCFPHGGAPPRLPRDMGAPRPSPDLAPPPDMTMAPDLAVAPMGCYVDSPGAHSAAGVMGVCRDGWAPSGFDSCTNYTGSCDGLCGGAGKGMCAQGSCRGAGVRLVSNGGCGYPGYVDMPSYDVLCTCVK